MAGDGNGRREGREGEGGRDRKRRGVERVEERKERKEKEEGRETKGTEGMLRRTMISILPLYLVAEMRVHPCSQPSPAPPTRLL